MTDPLEAAELHDVLDALHLALLGPAPSPSARAAVALHPRAAAPLAADADVHVVHADSGLWAVLRTSADGCHRLLCVHNFTSEELVFDPHPHLPAADGDTPLYFLGGRVDSEAGPNGDVLCRIRPRSFTWLGRSTSSSDAHATTLEAAR